MKKPSEYNGRDKKAAKVRMNRHGIAVLECPWCKGRFYHRCKAALAFLLLLSLVGASSAVRPGTTKVVREAAISYAVTSTTQPKPQSICIDASTADKLMRMRPDAQSVGYQGGYMDALADVRELFGLGRPRFRSGPSLMNQDVSLGYTLPWLKEGYWRLNVSGEKKIQYVNSNLKSCRCQENITEVRIWKK